MHLISMLASALLLPGFAHVADAPAGGQLLRGTFPGTSRPGYVYLPPAFDRARRYPVVYLLHGLPGSPSEYVHGMQLGELADRSIGAGVMRPFIAIIPAAGATPAYGGEWAGPWETALVERVVQWVDAHLPTIAAPPGRLIAGLSAGGYGAVDIALRHLGLFGTVEAWSGYFAPLPDGPFAKADRSTLEANDPTMLARTEAAVLRRDRIRFFLSTGPHHSRRIDPAATARFARELRRHGVTVVLRSYLSTHDEWRSQFDAGLLWGLGRS